MDVEYLEGFITAVHRHAVTVLQADGTQRSLVPNHPTVIEGVRAPSAYVRVGFRGRSMRSWEPVAPPTRALCALALTRAGGLSSEDAEGLALHAPRALAPIFLGDADAIRTLLHHTPWAAHRAERLRLGLQRYTSAVGPAFAARISREAARLDCPVSWSLALYLDEAVAVGVSGPAARWAAWQANPWRVHLHLGDPLSREHRQQLDALVEKLATDIPAKDARRLVGHVVRQIMQEVRRGHTYSPWALSRAVRATGASFDEVIDAVTASAWVSIVKVPDPHHPNKTRAGATLMGLLLSEREVAQDVVAPRLGRVSSLRAPQRLRGEQAVAAATLLNNPFSLLAGPAGSGKSYVLGLCAQAVVAQGGRVALLATTGTAAQRLAQATGLPATTLHAYIGYRPGAKQLRPPTAHLDPVDFLVVDESSMLDAYTAGRLAQFLLHHNQDVRRVCLAGDPYQLPPVGPGAPFRDLLGAPLAVATLEAIRRTESPQLIRFGRAIAHGALWADALPADLPTAAISAAEELPPLLDAWLTKWDLTPDAVGILAARHAGPLGITRLNDVLRHHWNPEASGAFAVQDRVIQTRTWVTDDTTIWNGTPGRVTAVTADTITVQFNAGAVTYLLETAQAVLQHAYALTVHRAQGGQFAAVVFVCDPEGVQDRALAYTALTRAVDHLVLVGPDIARLPPLEDRSHQRRTRLGMYLREVCPALDELKLV